MIKFPLFVLFLLSTLNPAAAQEAAMTDTQMIETCEAKHGTRINAVAQCIDNLRLAQLEQTDAAILGELAEGRERDEAILGNIDELGRKVDALADAQSRPATTQPAPQAQVPTTGVTYARTGGAAWAPVAQPTVVSIHNITGMAPDTLHITDLEHPTTRKTCGGERAPLVVFYDHGTPVTNVYAPSGAPTGFVEVYYDKQNDGVPDGTVMALDLSTQTDVWITWGQANDLTVRYLRPGGQIAVEGLPLQTVYHPTTRSEASASGAVGCDEGSIPVGGHLATPAYSLSRMW